MKQQAKMSSKETKMDSCTRNNCLREIEESEQKELGKTALLGREISLKGHGQPARRTNDFRRCFVVGRLRRGRLLLSRSMRLRGKAALQDSQLASNGSAKETVIANFHESMREDMLQEALKELLEGKGTFFELTAIRNTVLKGNLRSFHGTAVIK